MAGSPPALEFVYVQGKVKWFFHDKLDNKYEPPRWRHVMWPNAESLEKIRDLQAAGMKNVLKKDEDGYYVTFTRPAYKEYIERSTGIKKRRAFDPPMVLDAEGNSLPPGTQVGNGSDVTTKLEVYEHGTPGGGKAKASRWLSSKVDNLVPYDRTTDRSPEEHRAAKDLDKQPEQTW